MKVVIHAPATRATLGALAKGLVALNREILKRETLPPLYSRGAGVHYKPEGAGRERWQTALQVMGAGYGDCEDLAAWRAAELQNRGELARVTIVRTGPRRFHAVVRRGDGSIEDPSKILAKGRRVR